MANFAVFSAPDWEFLSSHPNIVWEAEKPVFYRFVDGVIGGPSVERYDIYLSLDQR